MQSLGREVARTQQMGAVPPQLTGVAVRVVENGRELAQPSHPSARAGWR